MIWLASFPRSGNTFLRNVLFSVYGLESSTYHQETGRSLDAGFDEYSLVKTHIIPDNLPKNLRNMPSIYLIRDGRDAMVSMAHHRSDIVAPGSDFLTNLLDIITTEGNAHFGGWSNNVRKWTEKASIVIHFEDLIRNPISQIERLREIIDLPEPDLSKLPSFKDLKYGDPKYGGSRSGKVVDGFTKKFFRKGKVGGWTSDMDEELEDILWAYHGRTMEEMGYHKKLKPFQVSKPKVLIDCKKLYEPFMDGIARYNYELIIHIHKLTKNDPRWIVRGVNALDGSIQSIPDIINSIENPQIRRLPVDFQYEGHLLTIKRIIKSVLPKPIREPLRKLYVMGPFRKYLKKLNVFLKDREHRHRVGSLKEKFDIFHAPLPQRFTGDFKEASLNMVTIHDVSHITHPQFHLSENTKAAEDGINMALELNSHVIAVSQHTDQEIKKHYADQKIDSTVVYEGVRHDSFNIKPEQSFNDLNQKYGLGEDPYVLCLSTIEPRKNLKNTIAAFKDAIAESPWMKHNLVIAGKKGWMSDQLVEKNQGDNRIIFTGFIDDKDLPNLYRGAKLFCYISFDEGFGLPLLEAMACGTPVIYGNNSAMKELIGNFGIATDPSNIAEIKKNMIELLKNEALQKELSSSGVQHVQQFSWLKTAYNTLLTYSTSFKSIKLRMDNINLDE